MRYILAVNAGSSSLKFALFLAAEPSVRHLSGAIDRIGRPDATLVVREDGAEVVMLPMVGVTHAEGAMGLVDWLRDHVGLDAIGAVGHRVVTGGPRLRGTQYITDDVMGELRRVSEVAPEHLPTEIALIEIFRAVLPGAGQFACFDTSFHDAMPRVARVLAVPRRLQALGVERRGFHGLSFASLMDRLAAIAGAEAARGRLVLAHLGNGSSLAAVRDGVCLDTSMSFTPASGIPMGSRSGDLDPGLGLFLSRTEGMTPVQFDAMVNRESGLLGISETSSDVRHLLAAEASDVRAAEALDVFCYSVRKAIGAYAAVLGGIDTLVFSGGIGENAPVIRQRICAELGFLGIGVDVLRNEQHAPIISSSGDRVTVRVIPTDEEAMIAKAVVDRLSVVRDTVVS